MKKILFIMILLTLRTGLSQTLTLVDKTNLQPLENAVISSSDGKIQVTTNAKGQADISSLKGALSIDIEAEGYQAVTVTYATLQSSNFTYAMIERSYTTDEIVISTSRFQQKLSDVPQQIDILFSNKIEYMNQQNKADLLMNTGQVFVQKSQLGGGSPVLRGFEANRVLVIVDGVSCTIQ
jgi:hemoglobin/transferrin/lactoferrin receptor protein